MLNYELAVRLKEAGFPKRTSDVSYVGIPCPQHGRGCTYGPGGHVPNPKISNVHYPTLEELIEACGEEFALLIRGAEGRWFAQGFNNKTGTDFLGSTPSEAVANLWLALNKKV